MHAVRSRNALLKQRTMDEAALESFSAELVKLGNEIIRARRELVPKFSPARAAGLSPHLQRRRGIAHRIPAEREK